MDQVAGAALTLYGRLREKERGRDEARQGGCRLAVGVLGSTPLATE